MANSNNTEDKIFQLGMRELEEIVPKLTGDARELANLILTTTDLRSKSRAQEWTLRLADMTPDCQTQLRLRRIAGAYFGPD